MPTSLSLLGVTTGSAMVRDPEARSLVLQSAALEARAEVLLGQLVDHTRWLQSVVTRMAGDDYVHEKPGSSEITQSEPKDAT